MTATAANDHQPLLFNAEPILNEIRHGLDQLLAAGTATIIDLQRLPFGVDDEQHLRDTLGDGEVHATIDSLGKSSVQETGVAGVWWVTHYSDDGAVLGNFIEVTTIPEILKSQRPDIEHGLRKLRTNLGADRSTATAQE